MAQFELPYGREHLTVDLPDTWPVELLAPIQAGAQLDPGGAVRQALGSPLGQPGLGGFAGVRSAAIAVSDKTRPVPHDLLLPPLLERLDGLGLSPGAITLLIATGTHPPMTPDEYTKILPSEVINRYPVISHDAKERDSLVWLGVTERGTPVWLNRHFVEAELRIVVGNIEPHQFMGFSGGVKSAVIGLAGQETINHNHAMMTDSRARLGRFDDNPARQDVEEMGRLLGVHFALNAILNEAKDIVAVLAGQPEAVMRAGIPLVCELYQVPVRGLFDLMLVSPGGHPKDINLYQAQKGLAHAALVVKEGGLIILAAACPEGTGSSSYESWMRGLTSYQAVFERFEREGFRIGPHKAFQIAQDAVRAQVLLVSEMAPDFVRRLLLTPAGSLEEALRLARETLDAGGTPRVGVMPWANATIPEYQHDP